jgi:hypothetical protein
MPAVALVLFYFKLLLLAEEEKTLRYTNPQVNRPPQIPREDTAA